MFLVLAFMYTVCQTIKGLVLEKETRLKEVLRAVGARNGPLWFAWFIENMVLLTIPCALISVMIKVSQSGSHSGSLRPSIRPSAFLSVRESNNHAVHKQLEELKKAIICLDAVDQVLP